MNDDNDLSSTVIAKSDQLNADELIEPITITVTLPGLQSWIASSTTFITC